MNKTLCDLHIHSCASDGTDSPEEILLLAKEKRIEIIAIADHNTVASQEKAKSLADKYSVKVIGGVEIDCSLEGRQYHVLGLGIDHNNKELISFVKDVRQMQLDNNRLLIERMANDYDFICVDEFDSYEYDRGCGGWKAVNYIQGKGLADGLYEVFEYYAKYDCQQSKLSFPHPKLVIETIHNAGGYAILAHPGLYVKHEPNEDLLKIVSDMMEQGIDGVECHYPKHSKEITEMCVSWCEDNQLMITGGSDYHGAFQGGNDIDSIKISLDMLDVSYLIK